MAGRAGPSSAETVDQNKAFFAENDAYARAVRELDTYRNVRAALNAEVGGVGRLLDVGNGAAFDYSPELVKVIVAVDLFLDAGPADAWPDTGVARQGDALDLDEPDNTYDAVAMVFLLHHLVGDRASDLVANARRAISEAIRVLEPGGRLIVAESCVPRWFFGMEQVLFLPLKWLAQTRAMSHPATLQPSSTVLRRLIDEQPVVVDRDEAIPVGRWMLQFGRRWPSALTPARPRIVVARKRATGGRG